MLYGVLYVFLHFVSSLEFYLALEKHTLSMHCNTESVAEKHVINELLATKQTAKKNIATALHRGYPQEIIGCAKKLHLVKRVTHL